MLCSYFHRFSGLENKMPSSIRNPIVIVAGASGLVGSCIMQHLLAQPSIQSVYSLTRRASGFPHPKLTEWIDAQLNITQWDDSQPRPTYGVIALGTTLKQAGSKQALEKIDFDLVCQVAKTMKMLGVIRLAVVSSYGANPTSRSHYLRCKGRMEEAIRRQGFEHAIFVRPGPLKGQRKTLRLNEIWLQRVMAIGRFFLWGRLKNLIPIDADSVAQAMLYQLFDYSDQRVSILHSQDIHQMLKKYQ